MQPEVVPLSSFSLPSPFLLPPPSRWSCGLPAGGLALQAVAFLKSVSVSQNAAGARVETVGPCLFDVSVCTEDHVQIDAWDFHLVLKITSIQCDNEDVTLFFFFFACVADWSSGNCETSVLSVILLHFLPLICNKHVVSHSSLWLESAVSDPQPLCLVASEGSEFFRLQWSGSVIGDWKQSLLPQNTPVCPSTVAPRCPSAQNSSESWLWDLPGYKCWVAMNSQATRLWRLVCREAKNLVVSGSGTTVESAKQRKKSTIPCFGTWTEGVFCFFQPRDHHICFGV